MPSWRNRPSMPKVRDSSGTIGTMRLPISLSLTRPVSEPHEGHGGRDLAPLGGRLEQRLERVGLGRLERAAALAPALRQRPAQVGAQLLQVLRLGRIGRGPVVRDLGQLVVGDRNLEAVAELLQRLERHLLLLVGDVLALAHRAHAVALDGLRQDHRRLPLVLHRGRVGGVHLVRIVAAAVQAPDLLVGHRGHHLAQLGVLAEEVLAHVGAVAALELLVLAVDGLFHALAQDAVVVAREQRIPVRAPDHLDDVPARAAEVRLQLLDDLPVAAHRTVEPLQVAVDDEDQVVEPLARREVDGAARFRLVHLAVAHERPHLAARGVGDAAVVQVAQEARLIDRLDRAQAHRHRRELPEVRHEPGVRIGREPRAADLLAEHVELRLAHAALDEGARVDAGRRVPLEVDQVTAEVRGGRPPEVVEAHVVERGGRGEAGDVPAEVESLLARAQDHGGGVPPHERAQPVLDLVVAGGALLEVGRDRVQVCRPAAEGTEVPRPPRFFGELVQEKVRPFGALDGKNALERVDPFARLGWIGI